MVPPGDAKALVHALKKLREDKKAWLTAHEGAIQARDVFTPQGAIDAWMERAWAIVKDDLND